MSNLPLHPMIVHLPLALSLVVPLVAAITLIAWHREYLPKRAFAIAAMLQVLLVLSGVAAMRTGDGDEHRVERVVAKALIHAHEDAAEAFVWSAGAIGLLFIAAAARPDGRSTKVLATLATVGSLLVFGLGLRAGHEGGELVYEHGAASVYTSGQPSHAGGATVAPNPTSGYDDD